MQIRQPLLVALAPRGDAVAQPVLLHRDLAAQLVPLGLLLRQHRVAPRLERREPLVQLARDPAVEPHRGARQPLQQPAVVADHHDAGAHPGQLALQPLDARQVQMVGRLVEQQDVRRRRQRPCQRRAPHLAARERRRVFGAAQPELFQQVARPVVVGVGVGHQPRLDIRERGGEAGQVGFLRQIADGGAGLGEAAAGVLFHQAGGDAQQGGLARAVPPDQADPVAGGHRQSGAGQQRGGAEGQVDVLQQKSGRRHGRGHTTLGRPRNRGARHRPTLPGVPFTFHGSIPVTGRRTLTQTRDRPVSAGSDVRAYRATTGTSPWERARRAPLPNGRARCRPSAHAAPPAWRAAPERSPSATAPAMPLRAAPPRAPTSAHATAAGPVRRTAHAHPAAPRPPSARPPLSPPQPAHWSNVAAGDRLPPRRGARRTPAAETRAADTPA